MIRAADRRHGRVFTPEGHAAALVARVLAPYARAPVPSSLRVVDPACGEGVFLVEAVRWVARHAPRTSLSLLGVDLDAQLLGRARCAVLEAGGPEPELRRADALMLAWGGERFDAVLGNPPWVSWSGRQAQPLEAGRRARLAERYETFSGWPCAHAPFVELAVRLARGRVGQVLPAQVCDLDGYRALRALLRREGIVEEPVDDLGEQACPGVVQPACALVWERRAGGSAGGGDAFALRRTDHGLVARLADCPRPPPGTFRDCGVHTGNCARLLLGDVGEPVREGRDVTPWRLAAPRRRVRVDYAPRAGEYFRIPPRERLAAIPVVLRQTAARPIAALHVEPALFRNSVLGCAGLRDVEPVLLVAWLNSDVIARYHAARVREAGQRAFPQVKVRHLQDLPMPDWRNPPRALAAAARRAGRDGADAGLRGELDDLVAGWFGLDTRVVRSAR